MRSIDAHLHTDMIEDVQLQKLVMMGMEAAVIKSRAERLRREGGAHVP
jgi:hypothetical protein